MPSRIEVVAGDITQQDADVVVNAANETLSPGGGVDGAIHRAAGPGLRDELRAKYTRCATGQAVLTRGHGLKAGHIVHTVGPVWTGGDADEDALLASCYGESLRLADEAGARTVALPAVATGAFGFPVERAARVAARAVVAALQKYPRIACARFVCFDEATRKAFEHAVELTRKELGWERSEDDGPPAGSGASSPVWMGSG